MNRTGKIATAAAAVLIATTGATAYAVSSGDDDGDARATGPGADRARAAALALFPGAEANSVERDTEDAATWEVEVRRSDGGTVDVRLDESYGLVVVEADDEDADGDTE